MIAWILNWGFCHFIRVESLYFLEIAHSCRLGQCLTTSWARTSKRNFVAEIGAEMIFSILMSSTIHSNVLGYIKDAAKNRKKSTFLYFSCSPFPVIAFIKYEVTGCINEEVIRCYHSKEKFTFLIFFISCFSISLAPPINRLGSLRFQ